MLRNAMLSNFLEKIITNVYSLMLLVRGGGLVLIFQNKALLNT